MDWLVLGALGGLIVAVRSIAKSRASVREVERLRARVEWLEGHVHNHVEDPKQVVVLPSRPVNERG
jgi:hypothetical protein